MMSHSKAKLAFMRKLYLSYTIREHSPSLPELQAISGMPRRTLQDCISGLADIGIRCEFRQQEGARNNAGYYCITDWGPIAPEWIRQQLTQIETMLGISTNQ